MLYIILPVHNRKALTESFVKDLVRQRYQDFHLLLIDDGSIDDTSGMVLSYLPRATIIKGRGDLWWGGSLQKGYEWIRDQKCPADDIVLIINDDVSFKDDFLLNAIACLQQEPSCLLLAQSYKEPDNIVTDRGVFADWKKLTFDLVWDDGKVNCFSTRGLFMRVSSFLGIGGFRPLLLPHYLSDYEFTIRAGRKGFPFRTNDTVRLIVNELTTGFHAEIRAKSFLDFLRKIFSKKSAMNPVYFTTFLILTCPLRYLPLNILRVWKGFLTSTYKYIKSRPSEA
jgi:GT2 family glycosyltransferase